MLQGIILLTGATGFLGSNLLPALLGQAYQVVVLKRTFSKVTRLLPYLERVVCYHSDKDNLEDIFSGHDIQCVIHCATHYGRNDADPRSVVEANLTLPLELLILSKKYQVPYFINTDTILDKQVNYYSLSKRHFYDWLTLYSGFMKVANMKLEHFYGTGDDPTKFVTRMTQDLLRGVPEIRLTKGDQTRDFIHVDDVVSAFMIVLSHLHEMHEGVSDFHVGTGVPVTIREFCETLKTLMGNSKTALLFGALDYRKNEVMSADLDVSPLLRLGWRPSRTLTDGLRQTIEEERKMMIGGNL